MSQPPVPPRKRNAPVVVYPGSPPPAAGRPPTRSGPPAGPPPGGQGGGRSGPPRQPRQPSRGRPAPQRRSGGKRALVIALVLVAVVAIAGGAYAILGGGGSGSDGPEFKASTSVDLQVGPKATEPVGLTGPQLPDDQAQAMLQSIGTYVDGGIVKALRTGKADDAELTPLFDAAAQAQLAGAARPVLFDEGLPKAVGKITVTTPPVAFTSLSAADDSLVLVATNVDLKISAQAEKGTVTIQRTGSFVFAPDGAGGWKITAWTFDVNRGGTALPTTTSAPAAPPSSTPTG